MRPSSLAVQRRATISAGLGEQPLDAYFKIRPLIGSV